MNKKNIIIKKNGFTLVELLVVIFIFSIIAIIASSTVSTGFISGRLKSAASRNSNREMKNLFEFLKEKTGNANAKATVDSMEIFGFRVIQSGGQDVLVIASQVNTGKECLFLKLQDEAAKTAKIDCSSAISTPTVFDQSVTSKSVKVTELKFSGKYDTDPSTSRFPNYVKVTAKVTDPKDGKVTSMESVYNLDLVNIGTM